jgi:thioredoxin 1
MAGESIDSPAIFRYNEGTMKKLLHFTAEWCTPCKAMKPVIASFLEENPNIEYEQIDVDNNPEITKSYSILSVPTFVAFYNDERIGSIGGAVPKARLAALFENYE